MYIVSACLRVEISTDDNELARQVERRGVGSKVVVLIVQGGVGQRPARGQKWRELVEQSLLLQMHRRWPTALEVLQAAPTTQSVG